MSKILEQGKKSIVLPLLFYRTIEARDGTQSKAWFTVDYTFSIWGEEPFEGDTLTLMATEHDKIGFMLRVYHVHFIDKEHGSSLQELTLNDSFEGLTIKKGTVSKELSEEEVREKVLSHKYQIRKDEGSRLVLPPVAEYSSLKA